MCMHRLENRGYLVNRPKSSFTNLICRVKIIGSVFNLPKGEITGLKIKRTKFCTRKRKLNSTKQECTKSG